MGTRLGSKNASELVKNASKASIDFVKTGPEISVSVKKLVENS